MERVSKKEELCPQLLDLISKEKRDWLDSDRGGGIEVSEEKKLELRLAPPGDWLAKETNKETDESLLSFGIFSRVSKNGSFSSGAKRGFLDTFERAAVAVSGESWSISSNGGQDPMVSSQKSGVLIQSPWSTSTTPSLQMAQQQKPAFLQFQSLQSLPVLAQESSQAKSTKLDMQKLENKACSPASTSVNAAVVSNNTKTRTGSVPVVGWPPIRSFRKNIASSSSSKPAPESQSKVTNKPENCKKGLFVKINMDGVPIGRKVDLKAYDSYGKLSCAVDELFRDLLAAQRDSSAVGNQNKEAEMVAITGLLDGSGEYTLVYEDNEGDRMLVGDVPWNMFITTVKRLRVLKSSELSALRLGSGKQEEAPPDSGVK